MPPRKAPRVPLEAIVPVAALHGLDDVAPSRQTSDPPLLQHVVVLVQHEFGIAEERLGIPAKEDHAGSGRRDAAPVQARIARVRNYADLVRLRAEDPLEFGCESRRWAGMSRSEDWHTSQR